MNIEKTAKIRVDWNVKPTDCTKEEENSIKVLMAKKYNVDPSNITVKTVMILNPNADANAGLNETDAMNIQDPKFQQELFKQYLSDNEIKDVDFEEILKIDSRVNSGIDYSAYEKSKRYRINWVNWDNFLSYGEGNHFDFRDLKGLVRLNGEPANESGKSTFAYDLLHFLLFGKINPDRAKTNDQLFNNYTDKNEVTVEGSITIDGEDFIIKRVLSRKAKGKSASQKVYYYKVLGDGTNQELADTENNEAESSTQTNRVIKEALGNEKDFDLIISANAKDLDDLISMGETDRGKLLSRWIGLSPLEDKEAKAKELYKQDNKGRYCDLYNTAQLKSDIDNLNADIKNCDELIASETKRKEFAESELTRINSEKDNLLSSKLHIDDDVAKLDATTLNAEISNIINIGKTNKEKLAAVDAQIEQLSGVTFDEVVYKQKVSEKETIIEELANAKTSMIQLEKLNKTLASQEYCPTCGRKFENVDNSGKIKENEDKIQSLSASVVTYTTQRAKVESEISGLDNDRALAQSRSKLELKKMTIQSDINNGRADYIEKKALADKLKANNEAIIKNSEIEAKINVLKADIRTQENVVRTASSNIASYSKQKDNDNANINECNFKIAKIEEEKKAEKNWKVYLQMIGKDGISKMVLKHALPIINSELHNLLDDCSDFQVEVAINDSNAVEFWLIREDVRTRLSAASGLEKTQAALALRVVLGKMSRLSCPPFILLDEVLGTVAAENYDKMKSLYSKIVELYDFVLHITHIDAIDDWHNMTLTVKKENNISSVKPLIQK